MPVGAVEWGWSLLLRLIVTPADNDAFGTARGSIHLTLCCPSDNILSLPPFRVIRATNHKTAHVWYQSRDLTSYALECSAEHARSCLDCGERQGQSV
jgi:hypothetical protein